MAWESGLVGGYSNPLDPNVNPWTLGYVASSTTADPLLGAVAAGIEDEEAYFNFFPLVAPVQIQPIVNHFKTTLGGYIRVPARLRRL